MSAENQARARYLLEELTEGKSVDESLKRFARGAQGVSFPDLGLQDFGLSCLAQRSHFGPNRGLE
jgi:hypothetical protein